jgi:uncharacterized repeat protein (TIGR03803 family)
MNGKRQFRNSPFNILSHAVTVALAIAVIFALTVVLAQSTQAQTPATGVGRTEEVLHSFGSGSDGYRPFAGLIFDAAGNLYGTTAGAYESCNYYGCGTVFELSPTAGGGWTEQVLHIFGNGRDGAYPYASLIFDSAGNLYGTTAGGGSTYCFNGCGTVFELTPVAGGWAETVLYSFCPQGGICSDGDSPDSALVFDAEGNLFGTTSSGGTGCRYNSCGVVWEITP